MHRGACCWVAGTKLQRSCNRHGSTWVVQKKKAMQDCPSVAGCAGQCYGGGQVPSAQERSRSRGQFQGTLRPSGANGKKQALCQLTPAPSAGLVPVRVGVKESVVLFGDAHRNDVSHRSHGVDTTDRDTTDTRHRSPGQLHSANIAATATSDKSYQDRQSLSYQLPLSAPGSAFSSAFGTRKTTRRHNVARSDVIQNQGLLRLRIPASRSDLSARSLAPRWTLSSDRDIWWGIGILEQQMTSGVRHQPQPLALFLAAKAP